MKIWILVVLLFTYSQSASSEMSLWSDDDVWTNTTLVASNTLIVVDYLQTVEIGRNEKFYERNTYLGRHPSRGDIDKYFAASLIFHNLIAYVLPEKYQNWYCTGIIFYRFNIVNDNYNLGVRIKF